MNQQFSSHKFIECTLDTDPWDIYPQHWETRFNNCSYDGDRIFVGKKAYWLPEKTKRKYCNPRILTSFLEESWVYLEAIAKRLEKVKEDTETGLIKYFGAKPKGIKDAVWLGKGIGMLKGGKKICLGSLTCAVVLGLDSPLQELLPEDSNLSDSVKSTSSVSQSLSSDTPAPTTTETLKELEEQSGLEKCKLSPQAPPASPSARKGKGKAQRTKETASPQSSNVLENTSLDISALKTCPDSSIAHTPQTSQISSISSTYCKPSSQITESKFLDVDLVTWEAPSLESEYFWLPAPTGLSSKSSRPPGLNKLENFLKQNGLINKGEVLDPDILSDWLHIPMSWLDPSESRTAAQLLEDNERQQEMDLTPELPRSPCVESCIGIQSENDFIQENEPLAASPAANIAEKPKRKQGKGCLYKYLENKKLKDGTIRTYPSAEGRRDPDNPAHWRWGFNWEDKINGEWKGRSIGSIPVTAIARIKEMQSGDFTLNQIITYIQNIKKRK